MYLGRPKGEPAIRKLLAVFLLALAARAVHVAAIGHAPFARLLIGDARAYDQWAASIAAGRWIGATTFYQAPLYPYALAVLYKTVGRDPMTIRWAQALLGALACVLLAAAGKRFFSERVGVAAGVLLAVYPPAVFFDGLVQKAALDNALMCAFLATLGAYAATSRRTVLLGAGAVLGLLALTRENTLVFLVIVGGWLLAARAAGALRARAAAIVLLLAGAAAVLVPVGFRNLAVGGEFLLTTSQAGTNFFIGNSARANGRYVPIRPGREMPEFERVDATQVAEQAVGRSLTPGEVSSYWWSRSWSWIRAHPGAWLALLGKKVLLTWNHVELPDTESYEVYQDFSPWLRWSSRVLGFGVLLTLAAAGMALAWRLRPRPDLLYLLLFGFSASVAAFYVFARYRFPMVPILVLFAAQAIVSGWDAVRAGVRRPAPLPLAAAALGAAVAALPVVHGRSTQVLAYENLGGGLTKAGKYEGAVALLRKAIDLDPRVPGPHYDLAVAFMKMGRTEDAASELEMTLRLDPDDARAHDNLGALLAERGNMRDAERHFREAYRLDPRSPKTLVNLGNASLAQGRGAEAVDWYRRALEIDPGYLDARLNLVQAYEREGRREDAVREAREVLRRDPQNAEAKAALARLGG